MKLIYDHYITKAAREAGTFRSGETVYEIDTGDVYEKITGGWQQTKNGGVDLVADGFKPSQDYISDLTMDNSAQAIALATNVNRITVWNQGATTEVIRVAFGTSAANAVANLTHSTDHATTGMLIPAYTDYADQCFQRFGVPALATHVAVENGVAADTQAVQIVQGI